MSVLENFEAWKEFLGERVDQAQAKGLSEDKITELASRVGDFLSDKIDPKNHQERLLKEMWDVSTEEEQRTLAKVMMKLVQQVH